MYAVDEQPPQRDRWRDATNVLSVVLAGGALVAAVAATGLGWRAVDRAEEAPAAAASTETAMVDLKEFSIAPVSIGVGGSLHVMNAGTAAHNLAIDGTKLHTDDLVAGASESLPLGDLPTGTYTIYCTIPGHREAGMQTTLTVGAAGSGSSAAGSSMDHAAMSEDQWAAMTKTMIETMQAFPATTQGVGNQVLEPTEVLADGTKVFDLDAKIAPWERAPGDVVDAWTYNGMVPAPSIHLQLGDHAQFRLRNDLPVATDLHLHGLNVDNQFDGVAPITQDVIEPGATFTYEYTADEVAVAMYHPHFMSQEGMPNGMFGTILVGELPLPAGQTVGGVEVPADVHVAQELPMVLNDNGVIGYSLNGKSFPATAPVVAHKGDWVLIHYYNEGSQVHPMHLHQFDQIVVAKDGFPLASPYLADTISVAPGERYSVLVHLDKVGTWMWHCHILPHVESADGMFGMVTAVIVQ
jgi:FtsP/CotA-like multicopper oxidase with cupredoxin domain